jgi:hypothetical protein
MKETWDKTMKGSASTNLCARADDLVAYLYNEATSTEARDFENHMQHCASCCTELAAFGNVREAIGVWRQQALGSLAAPALEDNAARVSAFATSPARRRSALGALREFFTLSPAWMRAATAVAALMFCALAAIAVAYFVQQPQTVIVEKPTRSGYSDEEVEKRIAEALKKQDESQTKDAPVTSSGSVADNRQTKAQPQSKRSISGATQVANNKRRQQSVPRNRVRPSTEPDSTDYLPFTASVDEEKLPTLTDLVNDDN